eukprot:365270-Chlamydomonas_euryale.AAC.20
MDGGQSRLAHPRHSSVMNCRGVYGIDLHICTHTERTSTGTEKRESARLCARTSTHMQLLCC